MIAVIYGTRPEIIKLSPIIRIGVAQKRELVTIHTGQHFSQNMNDVFFENLELPSPDYELNVGSKSHAEMVAEALVGIERILLKHKPSVVLVQGDTNSALAGALAAAKLGIKVGHIEAGLRSFDRRMPEELNRVLIDHMSDLLFAPTQTSYNYLLTEGISKDKIKIVGNTIADALKYGLKKSSKITLPPYISPKQYFLATLHRQENVDDPKTLIQMISNFQRIVKDTSTTLVLPLHPRTKQLLNKHAIDTTSLSLIEPQDYFNFLALLNNARMVFTDSGGIQEEACILGIPCITLRDNTERPETVELGSNFLVGSDLNRMVSAISYFEKHEGGWKQPYGEGDTAERIISSL